MTIDDLYKNTEAYIEELEKSFLAKHDSGLTGPEEYDLDVKSYCILCHAAFEDYVETLALTVIDKVIHNYVFHHRLSEALITLLHFKGNGVDNAISEDEEIISSYDYIRTSLNTAKSSISQNIFNNHGFSISYLKELLLPIAVDIPNDLGLLDSLKKLANARGAYAHKFLEKGKIKKSIDPEVAKAIVQDCLLLCWELKHQAKSRF